jgi:hypothetical protein
MRIPGVAAYFPLAFSSLLVGGVETFVIPLPQRSSTLGGMAPTTASMTLSVLLQSSSSAVERNDALLNQVLQVAIAASKKAGEIILGNAGGAEVTERKANSRDLLTLIDPLCETVSLQCSELEGR